MTLFELSPDDYNIIKDLFIELYNKPEPQSSINFNTKLELNNLHFPEKEKARLINQIRINLKQGKHIILTGPPGTGKSKLAKEICKQYVGDKYFKMVTATSDWSTFDTIGGYRPDKNNQLFFSSGIFLDCFKSDRGEQANNWLIIDEINRADIDKAFGPLFSALTGDPITLSFKDNQDKNIEVIPEEESNQDIGSHQYVIPDEWRIIATMNTFDKTSLYEMSYAFMRRFAFIPVVIPDTIDENLLIEYLGCWSIKDYSLVHELSQLWNVINDTRPIGPAIVEDIYQYLLEENSTEEEDSHPDYASAIVNYVLPQFEGLTQEELKKFFNSRLEELSFIENLDVIQRFARDYFHLGGK
ncbi:MAG: AAA family ATPase, partial [Halarsenatibacteraceae bacterium]